MNRLNFLCLPDPWDEQSQELKAENEIRGFCIEPQSTLATWNRLIWWRFHFGKWSQCLHSFICKLTVIVMAEQTAPQKPVWKPNVNGSYRNSIVGTVGLVQWWKMNFRVKRKINLLDDSYKFTGSFRLDIQQILPDPKVVIYHARSLRSLTSVRLR